MNKFIFSSHPVIRLMRHLAFWSVMTIYICSTCSFYQFQGVSFNIKNFIVSFIGVIKFVPLLVLKWEIPYCYIIIYFFAPFFLSRKRTGLFILCTFLLTVLSYYLDSIHEINTLRGSELVLFLLNSPRDFLLFKVPFTCIIFGALKMIKTWYLKEQEKQMLLKANADAEIQMLKAQVHPHFLFNTLNNIYSFTLRKSPKAEELVKQLTDMLKYMVNECNAEWVPLDKELKMLHAYLALENVRYGNHLDLHFEIIGDYSDKMVVPLLMIPFVENAFKHGASKVLERPWVKLKIEIRNNVLHMHLNNNKSTQVTRPTHKQGIGLINVEKRLKLLYRNDYELTTESLPETFSVYLQVPLKTDELFTKIKEVIRTEQALETI